MIIAPVGRLRAISITLVGESSPPFWTPYGCPEAWTTWLLSVTIVRGQFAVPGFGHQKSPPLGMSFQF
jgi:hypothetical protein